MQSASAGEDLNPVSVVRAVSPGEEKELEDASEEDCPMQWASL